MIGRGAKRTIRDSLGRVYVRRIKHLKRFNVTHKKAAGVYEVIKKVRRKRVIKKVMVEKPVIEAEMMDSFRDWAGGRSQIQRKLVDKLEQQELRPEGNGWYQKGFTYSGSGLKYKRQIKLRYNPSQKLLKIYIRGYEYAA